MRKANSVICSVKDNTFFGVSILLAGNDMIDYSSCFVGKEFANKQEAIKKVLDVLKINGYSVNFHNDGFGKVYNIVFVDLNTGVHARYYSN